MNMNYIWQYFLDLVLQPFLNLCALLPYTGSGSLRQGRTGRGHRHGKRAVRKNPGQVPHPYHAGSECREEVGAGAVPRHYALRLTRQQRWSAAEAGGHFCQERCLRGKLVFERKRRRALQLLSGGRRHRVRYSGPGAGLFHRSLGRRLPL